MTPEANHDIIAHALEEWPRETVGYLKDGQYFRLSNALPEDKALDAFELSPAACLEIQQQNIDALVHSHPQGTDHPTKTDFEQQHAMQKPWWIVVLKKEADGTPRVVELFEFGSHLPTQPYEGRSFRYGITDCRVLVRDWLRQEKNINIDPYWDEFGWWYAGEDKIINEMEAANYIKVNEKDARHGDVVLMKINSKVVNHMGIYLGRGLFLHHPAQRLSRVSSIESWRSCIDGYARYIG